MPGVRDEIGAVLEATIEPNAVSGLGVAEGLAAAAANVGQLTALQQRVNSLEMACAALWKLLKEQNGFTDEQLKTVIHEIDAADGAADGKVTKQGGLCPHCQHRILSRTANKCLWCGAQLDQGPFNVGESAVNAS